MNKNSFYTLFFLLLTSPLASKIKADDSEFKGVKFENLVDQQEVSSPFLVKMQVMGMEVKPAGEVIEGTGHHHLIVDSSDVATSQVVPADEKHLHFGKGQTETTLTLNEGKHTLTLQFADGAHRSYGPKWSKTISVVVVK